MNRISTVLVVRWWTKSFADDRIRAGSLELSMLGLVPLLDAAGLLLVDGIAEPEMIATGAPLGPCQIYGIIGLTTPYNIASQGNEDQRRLAAFLKENYIDKGKLGISTGEGLYKYPKS